MKTYLLSIEDDRYAIASLVYVQAATAGRARAIASQFLLRSPHHLGVSVHEGERPLFKVERERVPHAAE